MPGHFGCGAGLMSIVHELVRARRQPFVQVQITTCQDNQAKKEVLESRKLAVIAPEKCPI